MNLDGDGDIGIDMDIRMDIDIRNQLDIDFLRRQSSYLPLARNTRALWLGVCCLYAANVPSCVVLSCVLCAVKNLGVHDDVVCLPIIYVASIHKIIIWRRRFAMNYDVMSYPESLRHNVLRAHKCVTSEAIRDVGDSDFNLPEETGTAFFR
jgi:hypothetical protein